MSNFRPKSDTGHDTISKSHAIDERRVVLIGCTGHGKGAFGNFLYNLGHSIPGESLQFGESSRLDPDTQNPYIKSFNIKNSPNASEVRQSKLFKILDTPGLNDIGRDKDLKHMMEVLQMIGKEFESVHSLVLVYRFKTRTDASIGPALRYYRDLFAPLFRAHNVILVFTHVSSDDYECGIEKETFNEDVEGHMKQINEMLELEKPEWNCPLTVCYFVNSKWSNAKIEQLLKNIHSGKDFRNTDLLYTSYLMRERMLDYMTRTHMVVLNKHLISLPPALETERTSALKVIDGRIKELLNTVAIESKFRAEQLTKVEDLRTRLAKTKCEIEQCNARIEQLQKIQKTPLGYVAGDDWIRFTTAGTFYVTAPCSMESSGHSCNCEYKYEAHNASHPSGYPKISNRTWEVKVNPGYINVRQKENRYWFYKFWLEYDGKCHNATVLKEQQKKLDNLDSELRHLQKKLEDTIYEVKKSEKKLHEHHTTLEALNQDKNSLVPTQFPLSKMNNIMSCMDRYMK